MATKRTGQVALGGILCGLSLSTLFLTFFEMAVYALPAFAGILLLPMTEEYGIKWGLGTYAVTTVLALIFIPNWEAKLLFALFFGYYPILKSVLDRRFGRVGSTVLKLVVFNIAMIVCYTILVYLFRLDLSAFELFGINFMWGFLLIGNGIVILFDYALSGIVILYRLRLHPLLSRLFRYR